LAEWLATQSRFANEADLARELGLKPAAVYRWRKGQRKPSNQQRRKLFELTGLECYRDAADWKPCEKRARRKNEPAVAPVVAQLVIRCGVTPRELQSFRLTQVEPLGIRRTSGLLIPFGEGWEHVERSMLDDWIARVQPKDLLFFSLRPVDRMRPATPDWIRSALRESGVAAINSRRIYMRHFAGDFGRFRTDRDFIRHVRQHHGMKTNGAWAMLYRLRRVYEKLSSGAFARGRCKPEDAYGLLFSAKRPGAPATKRNVFVKAQAMRAENVPWSKIAKTLIPEEYRQDWRHAIDQLRIGVRRLKTTIE